MHNYNKDFQKEEPKINENVNDFIEKTGKIGNAEEVYVREEPSKDSKPVTTIKKDQEVMILSEHNGDWYKVCLPSGLEGYMMKSFVII